MGDKTRGLFHKFNVTRTDGTHEPGRKHDGCDYIVLDLTHDPYALDALRTYARKCRAEYPLLADDMDAKVAHYEALKSPFFSGQSGHGR